MTTKRKSGGALLVAVVLLFVFVVGLLFRATNGFSSDVKTFALKRNGKETILNDKSGLSFAETEQFEIVNVSTTSRTFSVKIYACGGTDFEYTYGAEDGYSWKEFAEAEQRDFTSCFDVVLLENRITIKRTDLDGILFRYDSQMRLSEGKSIPAGDMFELVVTCGEEKITLGFSVVYTAVEGIELNPETVVF